MSYHALLSVLVISLQLSYASVLTGLSTGPNTSLQLHGATLRTETPQLLSVFKDPSAFIGWGYPSVFRVQGGFRMTYQGFQSNGNGLTKQLLMAESVDGVMWKIPMGSHIVAELGSQEIGLVYDDGEFDSNPETRLKALLTNTSVWASANGTSFAPFVPQGQSQEVHWEATRMDPGFGMLRMANGTVVVTSRPPALRAHGRHAGIHSASNWSGLSAHDAHQCFPIDSSYTYERQIYGLPVFRVPNTTQHVGFVWIYRCTRKPSGVCYSGGNVSASLVTGSSNALNWSLVGDIDQPVFPATKGQYLQQYPSTLVPTEDAWLVHASAATVQHGTQGANHSAILTYKFRPHGLVSIQAERGAHRDGSPGVVTTPSLSCQLLPTVTINVDTGVSGHIRTYGINAIGTQAARPQNFHGDTLSWSPWSGSTGSDGRCHLVFEVHGTAKLFSVSY